MRAESGLRSLIVFERVNPPELLVFPHSIAINRFALFKKRREDIAPEIHRSITGNRFQRAGFKRKNARADPMRKDLIGARLFQKSRDAIMFIKPDDAALSRVVAVMQRNARDAAFRFVKFAQAI